jgi:hypothetical protein
MGILYFDSEIKRRLGAMAGVTGVEVGRTHDLSWSEDDISAHGQELLRQVRLKRLRELPIVSNAPTAT